MEIWKQSACTENTYIVPHSQLKIKEAIGHNVTMFKALHELMTSSGSFTQILRASICHFTVTYSVLFLTKLSLDLKTAPPGQAIYSDRLLSGIPFSRNVPGSHPLPTSIWFRRVLLCSCNSLGSLYPNTPHSELKSSIYSSVFPPDHDFSSYNEHVLFFAYPPI